MGVEIAVLEGLIVQDLIAVGVAQTYPWRNPVTTTFLTVPPVVPRTYTP